MAALALLACAGNASEPSNLLRGKRPVASVDVDHAERLSDGITPVDGDPWQTDLSAVFRTPRAYALFDLGESLPLDAAFLQGDNNDRFILAVSEDGRSFHQVWRAEAVPGAGMRPRLVSGLGAHARYLRLSAIGGDPAVSVGEILVFAQRPAKWPPRLALRAGQSPESQVTRWFLGFGLAFALALVLLDRRLPLALAATAVLGVVAIGVACARGVAGAWPPALELSEALRAVLAALAVLVVIAWSTRHYRPRRFALESACGVLALLGFLCFYDFGRPWFWNAAEGRPTPVHLYDMRVYFPVAKYFDELRFDGVYFASVKAYLVGEHLSPQAVADVGMRDLRTNHMVTARNVMDAIDTIDQRFTPERFAEFVEDMRFFWRTMGPRDYLGSLADHGGNATPVWLSIAHVLFAKVPATERVLTLTSLLDPALMLLAFVCIGRSFGIRAMLVCAVLFGTTDYPMFGSDWAGSTLRFDWMATLGLGLAALRSKRFALGGALLAHAGLVRAFPGAALVFTPVPLGLFAIERLLRKQGLSPRALVRASAGLPRALAGAALATALLVSASCALFGAGPAWGGWVEKIAMHTEDANTNHLGVRTVTAFDPELTAEALTRSGAQDPWREWQRTQLETYHSRAALAWGLRALFTLLCIVACRGATLERAALLGLLLVPVFTYPANYYCHYVYLLPLLAVDCGPRLRPYVEAVLLGSSVLQFFTLSQWVDVRFFWEAVILLASFAAVLVPLAVQAYRGRLPVVASNVGTPASS